MRLAGLTWMPAATEKHVTAIQMTVARTAKMLPTTGTKTSRLHTTAAIVGGSVKLRASLDPAP